MAGPDLQLRLQGSPRPWSSWFGDGLTPALMMTHAIVPRTGGLAPSGLRV